MKKVMNFIVVSLVFLVILVNIVFSSTECFNNSGFFCSANNTTYSFSYESNLTNNTSNTTINTNNTLSVFSKIVAKKDYTKLIISGITFGLMDGILNPCVLSLILIMTLYLISLGTRKKVLRCGIAFVITVAVVYAIIVLLIALSLNYLAFSIRSSLIPLLAILLLIFAIIEIKEFIWYGKGLSLKLPDFAKKRIEKLIKKGTIISAILVGGLSTFLNLGCTGTFPLAYAILLQKHHLELIEMILFIIWYDIWFSLPLLGIVLGYYYKIISIEKIQTLYETKKRYMRLCAGIILLIFSLYLLTPFVFVGCSCNEKDLSKYKLIIFYSESCPHCHELLNDLEKLNINKSYYVKICIDTPQGTELWYEYCKKFNSTPFATPTVIYNNSILFIGYTKSEVTPKLCQKYGADFKKIFNCSTCYWKDKNCYLLTREILEKICKSE